MCEFKVILEDGHERTVVAWGAIKAKLKEGRIALMDVTGVVAKVERATIVTVDTMMRSLFCGPMPLSGSSRQGAQVPRHEGGSWRRASRSP